MTIRSKFLFIFFIGFISTSIVNAAVFTSVANGNFNNPNTWNIGNGMIPGEMDEVIIRHEVYLNLTSKKIIKDISISNIANANSGLEISGVDSLVVLNNVQAASHNIDKFSYLWIGGNATVIIGGNCHFLRVAENETNKYFDFSVVENAKTFIKGSFRFDYLGASLSENNKEVNIENNGLLDVEGKTIFTNSAGNDFNLGIYDNAEAFLRDSLIVILNGTGAEAGVTIHDSSNLHILSSVYLFNSSTASNDFAKLRTRGVASNIYIQENVFMESHSARVKLEMEGLGGIITVGGDIIMNASAEDEASINIVDQGELYLGGDLIRQTNFGRLTMENEGVLVFNGSSPQIIPQGKLPNAGTDSLFFKEIRLENTSSQPFVLTENMIVQDSLILTNGNLISDSTAMVVLEDGAILSGNSTAYIEGPVKKLGTTLGQDITFPIGTDDAYAPITLSTINNPSSEVTVQYFSEPPPFGAELFESSINNVSTDGHWTVEKNVNTGDLDITLTWEDSNEAGIAEVNDLVVAGWDGTEWISFGQESAGLVGTGGFVTSALSEPPPFGAEFFTIASTSSLNSLPVELKSFDAIPRSGSVDLKWESESEINVSHFLVERSVDGISYEPIDYVKSTGGASILARYKTKDSSPFFGWNYYRLKMVDLDGSYEYSPVKAVKLEKNASILLYPNPVKDVLFIQDIEAIEQEVRVEIFDRNSSKVFESEIPLNGGPVRLAINDIQSLPSGYYIVKITGKSGCQFLNFVIAE